MRTLFLQIAIALTIITGLSAQCPETNTQDVRTVFLSVHLLPGELSFKICNPVTIHPNILFQLDDDFNFGSNQTCIPLTNIF